MLYFLYSILMLTRKTKRLKLLAHPLVYFAGLYNYSTFLHYFIILLRLWTNVNIPNNFYFTIPVRLIDLHVSQVTGRTFLS